jgi:pseudaminic acid synthase
MGVQIGSRRVGYGFAPFVIAEMSGNHNQSLDRALAVVEAAAAAGAHALKLQTYTAETMTLDLDEGDFRISNPESPWAGQSLYRLYERAATPWEWHEPIFDRARQLGLIPFSTPFDETAVDFLETLDVPCYKIASFENTDLPLIRKAAATGKPVLISTGMATAIEIGEAVEAARAVGCTELILLKCTSSYPASPENTNIVTIPNLRDLFGCEVGLSDHTLGIGVAVASVALGATVIEKHFTLRRSDGGVDSAFSMEPEEMMQLVVESHRAWLALGKVAYGVTAAEASNVIFRRSLYVVRDMEPGEAFSKDNVRAIRPGNGLSPKHLTDVLGRCAATALRKGTPLTWNVIALNEKR